MGIHDLPELTWKVKLRLIWLALLQKRALNSNFPTVLKTRYSFWIMALEFRITIHPRRGSSDQLPPGGWSLRGCGRGGCGGGGGGDLPPSGGVCGVGVPLSLPVDFLDCN